MQKSLSHMQESTYLKKIKASVSLKKCHDEFLTNENALKQGVECMKTEVNLFSITWTRK